MTNQNSSAFGSLAVAIAIVAVAAAVGVTGMTYVSAIKSNQRNQTIDACYQVSQDTWESKWQEKNGDQVKNLSHTIHGPVKEAFEQCMKEKGLR